MLVFVDVIGAFCAFILVLIGIFLKLAILFYIFATGIGHIITFIVTLHLIQHPFRISLQKERVFSILKEAFPLAATVILTVAFSRIDIMMLSYFFNTDTDPDIGYYALGYRIFNVITIFGSYYTSTLFPYFSRKTKTTRKEFIPAFKITLFMSIMATVGLYLFSEVFIHVVGGAEFIPAVPVLHILSLAAGFTILSGFLNSYLIAYDYEKVWLWIAGSALLANFVLNYIAIPRYSYIGASWTTVITQVWILIGSGAIVYHNFRKHQSS